MTSQWRFQLVLVALVFALAGAAFALGIGVKGLSEDGVAASPARAARGSPAAVAVRDSRFALLDEVYEILDTEFVEPERVDLQDLRFAAITGAVNSLNDPHQGYLDAETFRLTSEGITGSFEGIGVTVTLQGGQIIASSVYTDSPADFAGIRSGDVFLAVDGESTESWTLPLIVARVRGPAGSDVVIRVLHTDGATETITITRGRIIVPSVRTLEIRDGDDQPVSDLAYVSISQFTSNTRGDLIPILESVRAGGYRGLIIDVRGNPGGLLSATVETTSEFLDGGVVLVQRDRNGVDETFNAAPGSTGLDILVVVLVNGGSASGSEVFAAALRDHNRAVIIGEQTTGKGTVNVPRRLSDGSVLYVSTSRWLTPNGDLIEGVGLIPDIIVEPTQEDLDQRRDVQLFAAIEFLRTGSVSESAAPLP